MQMDEREKLRQELEAELQWIKYRHNMLDIIEEKLLQMSELAEQANHGNLTIEERDVLNTRINDLATQVRALDSESRRIEDGKILK